MLGTVSPTRTRRRLALRPHTSRLLTFLLVSSAAAGAYASRTALISRPTRLKAVLFDIDGTLFHSDAVHLSVFQDVLAEAGFDGGRRITEEFFKDRISGRQNAMILVDLFPQWTVAEAESFAVRKEERFRECVAEQLPSRIMPGLLDFCADLEAAGVRCAAVTNAPRANAVLMLQALTIGSLSGLDFFAPLIIGDECARGKPHPDPYEEAMRRLGVSAADCLAFEDSLSGATAAVAAGVRTIGITSSQPAETLIAQAGCARAVSDFADEGLAREMERWAAVL